MDYDYFIPQPTQWHLSSTKKNAYLRERMTNNKKERRVYFFKLFKLLLGVISCRTQEEI